MNMSIDMEENIIVKREGNNLYTKTEGSDGMGGTTTTELWYVDGMIYTEEYDESLRPIKVRYEVTYENVTEGGWFDMVEDTYQLFRDTRREYPDVPYFFFGHSMGSFVLRTILTKYPDSGIAGAIICGTGWMGKPIMVGGLASCLP